MRSRLLICVDEFVSTCGLGVCSRTGACSYGHDSCAAGTTALVWSPPASPGATLGALHYDTLWNSHAAAFGAGAACIETDGPDTTSTDADNPPPGGAFFYLVRARDWCHRGIGTLGYSSTGVHVVHRARPGRTEPEHGGEQVLPSAEPDQQRLRLPPGDHRHRHPRPEHLLHLRESAKAPEGAVPGDGDIPRRDLHRRIHRQRIGRPAQPPA